MANFHQLATDRSSLTPHGGDGSPPAPTLRLVSAAPSAGRAETVRLTDRSHPRPVATMLAQAIAETLVRARQVDQLDRLLTAESNRSLRRAIERTPLPADGRMPRPRVTSLRLTAPRAGVVEACAVIDTGTRKRALAFRLESTAADWQCTALRVG
jgi:hypothetical protein